MGSRGQSGMTGGRGGGAAPSGVLEIRDLVSDRERHQQEVDEVLTVARDIQDQYGDKEVVNQFQIAKMNKRSQGILAYCDQDNNIAINETYFNNSQGFNQAYDDSIKTGFHPSRGSKTAREATTAHEMGHMLVQRAAERYSSVGNDDQMAKLVVQRARDMRKDTKGIGWQKFAAGISEYATKSYHETVAEAVADVYCNGTKAKTASKDVVWQLKSFKPEGSYGKIVGLK